MPLNVLPNWLQKKIIDNHIVKTTLCKTCPNEMAEVESGSAKKGKKKDFFLIHSVVYFQVMLDSIREFQNKHYHRCTTSRIIADCECGLTLYI